MNKSNSKNTRNSRKPVLTAGQKAARTKGDIGLLAAGSRAQITKLHRVMDNLSNPADKAACTRKIRVHTDKLEVMGLAA